MATSNPADRKAYHHAYQSAHKARLRAYRQAYTLANMPQDLFYKARARAGERGLPFTITKQDIVIPEFCPVLGIRLERCPRHACDSSPTLDRLVPELGYTPDNIRVISHLANRIKSNFQLEQLEAVVRWLKQETHGHPR